MTLHTVTLYKSSNCNGKKKHLPVSDSLSKPPSNYKAKVSTANKTGGGVSEKFDKDKR